MINNTFAPRNVARRAAEYLTTILARAFVLATLGSSVALAQSHPAGTLAEPAIEGPWLHPNEQHPAEPRWGFADGLQVGIHPLGGPRGLLRIYAPYLDHPRDRLINFIAVEPIVAGEESQIFIDAVVDGIAGFAVGALFGKWTKGGEDIAEALEGYARSLNRARFAILPREGSLATEAAKLKAIIARDTAIKDVNEAFRSVALEIAPLFALDSTLGSAFSGGIHWIFDVTERVTSAIDRAMERFDG